MDFRRIWVVLIVVGYCHQTVRTQCCSSSCATPSEDGVLLFTCPSETSIEDLDIDEHTDWNWVKKFQVKGTIDRGPLTRIPPSICRLTKLKELDLSDNRIKTGFFRFSSPCLPELEILDLSHNFLEHIPSRWMSQLTMLRVIKLEYNQLKEIPYQMFHNLSNIEQLDVSVNQLTTFEFWLISIKNTIDYTDNPVTHFTNQYNIDLSNYQTPITASIQFDDEDTKINFDDSLLEMYNRCTEINSTNTPILMQAIGIIHSNNSDRLNWTCSCAQYHFYKYVTSMSMKNCTTDLCLLIDCFETCTEQSSFDTSDIRPRFCEIYPSGLEFIPQYTDCDWNFLWRFSDLETISWAMYTRLQKLNSSDEISANHLAEIIDQFDQRIQSNVSLIITPLVQKNFQAIITYIEQFISSISTPLDIAVNFVAILTVQKNSSITSYSQIQRNRTLIDYSTENNEENFTTSVSIAESTIEELSLTDIYTFYYLPSSLFRFTSNDETMIIISPIVGIDLPQNTSRSIELIFTGIPRLSGRYICVFWNINHWNDTGCSHSYDSNRDYHICICNHTTSFALIFIPNKMISQTYIPSIIVAILSIVSFGISIVLSIYRQSLSSPHLSIVNIFTLTNSMIFFCLLTVILITGYRSKDHFDEYCSQSQQNLLIATYFFLISTFASKTLLGICYFFTIFFHFLLIRLTILSNLWLCLGFLLVIIIALIPTIVVTVLIKQSMDFFVQYQGICWLNSSVVFRFVSIPIIVFLGLNALIILAITIRLVQFSLRQKTAKFNERRMIISTMIWLALCVLLGMAWIFGPFLDVVIRDKEQRSSIIQLWIFAIFIGLEGVWVLIVNIVFYVNQREKKTNRSSIRNKNKY